MGKNQWVSPTSEGKWKVHGEGNSKATKVFDNKSQAVAFGKGIAKNQQSELIIQKKMEKFNLKIVMVTIHFHQEILNTNRI